MHRIFLRTIAVLLGLTLITLMLVALRVATKPLSLDFLVPRLERALTPEDSPYEVKLRQVVLDWTSSERGLDITALGARVIDENGRAAISIPRISVEISGKALLRGLVAPKKIELLKPDIHLTIGPRGGVELRVGEGGKEEALLILSRIFDDLLAPHNPAHPSSYIKSIKVWDGSLIIEDSRNGTSWHAPKAELSFERAEQGVRVAASFGVEIKRLGEDKNDDGATQGEKERAMFLVNGFYPRNGGELSLRVSFTELEPALLAQAYPPLSYFKGVKVPIKGAVGFAIDNKGRLGSAWFHLSGERGELELPSIIDRPTWVKDLYVDGELDGSLSSIKVNEFHATADDTNVRGSGTIMRVGDVVRLDGKATAEGVAVNNLDKYWPQASPSVAREIITEKLHLGVIERATASFIIEISSNGGESVNGEEQKKASLKQAEGSLEYSDITASYLSSMPPVRNAHGTATFTEDILDINVLGGEIDGILLDKGRVIIGGVDGDRPRVNITTHISGALSNALNAMNHPPLRIMSFTDIEPESVSGSFDAEIAVDLPLTDNTGSNEINIVANAEIVGAGTGEAWEKAIGAELSNGGLSLKIVKNGGELKYNMLINKLTVDASPRLNGTVTGSLSLTSDDAVKKRRLLEIAVDLLDTHIELPELGWEKTLKTPGSATLAVDLEEWMSAEPQEFSIESKGLEASGSASLRADEQGARVINLRHLAIGKTDVNGSILIKPHFSEGTKHKGEYAYEVLVRGDRLDAKPIIEFIKKTKDKSKLGDKGKGGRGQDIKIPPIKIDAKVGQLLIGDDEEKIENISGVMTHGGKVWESVVTYGEISGKPIVLRLTPKEGDDEGGGTRRELILNSEDAGSTLRALDLYRSMKGGKLKLKADISDGLTEGKLVIKDCVILDAPILTKMFTLASFTGLANLIAGEGIRFDKLKARFNKSHDQIEIDGATAWGSNIGITVERGYVDLEGDSMEFEGLLIPAYTLNKFLNKIPLIGKLITGGKGSGILAANYTVRGPVRDPEISVNPLSVLTPGILRIFVNALKEAVPEAGEPVDEEKTTTPP